VARKGCVVVICVGTFFAWLRALELRRILLHMKNAVAILSLDTPALTLLTRAGAFASPYDRRLAQDVCDLRRADERGHVGEAEGLTRRICRQLWAGRR
jgi:hypothetical protein